MEVVICNDVYQYQQQTQQQSQRNIQSTQKRPYSNAERQRRYREKRKADKINACTTFSQSSDVQQEQPQHDVQINKRQPQSNAERQRKYRKLLREQQQQQQQMEDINAITVLSNTPHTSSIHQLQNVDQAEQARKRHLNKQRQSRFRARQRIEFLRLKAKIESPSTSSHQAQAERMETSVRSLCRLCAKKDEYSKDLFDESNIIVLKLLQDFIQTIINDNDNLPTKICMSCEQQMISFHQFILECHKVQETLKKTSESFDSVQVKLESTATELEVQIKSEVEEPVMNEIDIKEEYIVCTYNNEAFVSTINANPDSHSDYNVSDKDIDEDDNDDGNDDDGNEDDNDDGNYVDGNEDDNDDDFLEGMATASLKHLKVTKITEQEPENGDQALKQSKLNVKDFVKMETSVRNLCRLCAKEDEFSKELFDERNVIVLKLLQDFVQMIINDNDNLPTKICMSCEQKMISFQQFILECHKVQETLKKMSESFDSVQVKLESTATELEVQIKSEVEDPIMNEIDIKEEYIVCTYNNEASVSVINANPDSHSDYNVGDKDIDEDDNDDGNDDDGNEDDNDDDFLEEMATAPLKHLKVTKITEQEAENGDQALMQSKLNVKDFVKCICSNCQKIYPSWCSLKRHCQSAHKVSPVVTCICGTSLKSKSLMYKHVQGHRNANMLSCDKCYHITKSLAALHKHKLRHIPKAERKLFCASCNKAFTSKDTLKSHIRSHIPIEERRIYRCDICNIKFTTRSSAVSHKRMVHNKIKSYSCDLCEYACGTNFELRKHRITHSEEKPFACKKCSKSFKSIANLKLHMDTHEDTSYECTICKRMLNSRRTLRQHLLVHEDQCSHVCSYCDKAFKRKQSLKVHIYTHTGEKPLTCNWCDERFSKAAKLRLHRLRYHSDKIAAQSDTAAANDVVVKKEVECI